MLDQQPATSKAIVLVVEDDPLLLMAGIDLVEEARLQAIEARNADEAVAILLRRSDIRVVFTDVEMPNGTMDGLKLAAAVRDRWPPIKIIIASGQRKPSKDELPEGALFFPKPYPHAQVIEAMRQLAA